MLHYRWEPLLGKKRGGLSTKKEFSEPTSRIMSGVLEQNKWSIPVVIPFWSFFYDYPLPL